MQPNHPSKPSPNIPHRPAGRGWRESRIAALDRPHLFTPGRLSGSLALLFFFTSLAFGQPQAVLSDGDGISGFELYNGGVVWWNRPLTCSGEFGSPGTVRARANLESSPSRTYALGCEFMKAPNDSAVRDSLYVYFFSEGQLFKKPLAAVQADPPVLVPTPPLSPTLLPGEKGTFLEIEDGLLWFGRYNPQTGNLVIYRFNTDESESAEFVLLILGANAPVKKMQRFQYVDGNGTAVEALAVLLANGKLYLCHLTPTITSTLMAEETPDFAIHTRIYLPDEPVTSLYLINKFIGTDALYRIDLDNLDVDLIFVVLPDHQLVALGADGTRYGFDSPKNIYVAEQTPGGVAIRKNAAPAASMEAWGAGLIVQAGQGGVNLRSDNQWLYWRGPDGQTLMKIATDAPPIQLDIAALGLEVGQTISQLNLGNQVVNLAAYKEGTYARGYAYIAANNTAATAYFPYADLHVFIDGKEIPESPLTPLDNTPVRGTGYLPSTAPTLLFYDLRPQPNASFLFELPPLKPGTLTCTLDVNPGQSIIETGPQPYQNNQIGLGMIQNDGPPIVVKAVVHESVVPCLRMYTMPTGAGVYSWKPWSAEVITRAKSLLPCRDLDHWLSPWDWEGEKFFTSSFGGVNSKDSQDNDALDKIRCISEQTSWPNGCPVAHWVGMIHPDVANFGGLGERPGESLIISMEDSGGFENIASPRGGRTLAHELAHNYGRTHVNCCGNVCPKDPDPNYPYDDCQIGFNIIGSWWGFDALTGRAIAPDDAGDLMSYRSSSWISSYTWDSILGVFLAGAGFQASSLPTSTVTDAVFVSGTIWTDVNAAQLNPFVHLPANQVDARHFSQALLAAATEAGNANAYWFRLLDSTGQLLSQSALPLLTEGDPEPRVSFAHWLPFSTGTRRLQLVQQGNVLAERILSPNAPLLQLAPVVVDPAAQTLSLSWTASDADGDAVFFNIHYSTDNGQNWELLRNNYTGLSLTLDTTRLPGSERALLRVCASDGVNTMFAVTAPFAIPNKAPQVLIAGVMEGESLVFGKRARLIGSAHDPEQGSAGKALHWTVNGPTPRTGNDKVLPLQGLSPGSYQATLTATDLAGNNGTAVRSFDVLPLTVPTVASAQAPVLDGLCNDEAYANAAFLTFPLSSGVQAPVRMLHAGGSLYVSFSELELPLFNGPRHIGLRVDRNASGEPLATTADIGFFIDSDGVPYEELGTGTGMQITFAPKLGFTGVVRHGSKTWSAEFRIADSLLGGWNHLARIMIDHDLPHWPTLAGDNQPSTWALAYFGDAPPRRANRRPVAEPGAGRIANVTVPHVTHLNGEASHDPDGDPLQFRWTQVSGPSVNLSNSATANPSFLASPVLSVARLRFQLIVSDGTLDSDPVETEICLVPTVRTGQPVVAFSVDVGQPREAGSTTDLGLGSYSIGGGGSNIFDVIDQFHFAYQQRTGDFDVRVRVESLEPVHPSAKAGLMIRESLDPASRMAWVRVTPAAVPTLSGGIGSNDVRFAYRTGVREIDRDGSVHNGGRNEEGSGTPGYPNAWLRLRRTGAVLIAYHGSNGVDWIEQGRQDTARWAGGAFPAAVFLGLAVTSHDDSSRRTARAEFREWCEVLREPVHIITQPADAVVPERASATFSANASGQEPLTYQWFRNHQLITGATTPSYTTPPVTPADHGVEYQLIVRNAFSTEVSHSAILRLADSAPPTLHCPSNLVAECQGAGGTPVTFNASAADNREPNLSVVCLPPSGSFFPLGQSMVNCAVTNSVGNSSRCGFIVTIMDTRTPVAACAPNFTVEYGGRWNFVAPTATDGCSSNIFVQVLSTTTNRLCGGTYSATRTWRLSDSSSNGITCSQTVTVVDTTPPFLACPFAPLQVTAPTGGMAVAVSLSAVDQCDPAPVLACTWNNGTQTFVSGRTLLPPGEHSIRCTATDACTNVASCEFVIQVRRSPTTRAAVADYVRTEILGGTFGHVTLWMTAMAMDRTHVARDLDPRSPDMPFPFPASWLVTIDDQPEANFGHRCRWLFVDDDLTTHTPPVVKEFPPTVWGGGGSGAQVPFGCAEVTPTPCPNLSVSVATNVAFYPTGKGCLKAVLISGGINTGSNFDRYRQNLRSMYQILRACGFQKSAIWVYYADGSSLDLDNLDGDNNDATGSDVTGPASKANLRTRIQILCHTLNPNRDVVLLYTSNHGADDAGLCLWDSNSNGKLDGSEIYSPGEFASDTADCQVCRLFGIFDQCYSGEFTAVATDGSHKNTAIYAAATAFEPSYGRQYMSYWETLDPANTDLNDMHASVTASLAALGHATDFAEGAAGIGDVRLCKCWTYLIAGVTTTRLRLTFETEPQLTYDIESTDNLARPNWQVIRSYEGTGELIEHNELLGPTHRFYRIRER